MAHDVFISHSSKDKVMADAICSELEARGIRCWIAPRDVLPGEEWTKAIVEAITSCKIFLLVFSDNANNSSQIIKEVDCAASDEKTILPFRIEDIKPTGSMKYYLGSLHWLDAMTPPMEIQIGHLADYISHILGFPKQENIIQKEKPENNATSEVAGMDREPLPKELPGKPKKAKAGLIVGFGIILVGFVIGILYVTKGNLLAQMISQPSPSVTVTVMKATSSPTVIIPTEKITYTIKTKVSPVDSMTMVFVPAGDFLMGSPEKIGEDDEHPQHLVFVDSFWIDQTEVTNAMFQAFTTQTGYKTEAERVGESKALVETNGVFIYQAVKGANWSRPNGPASTIKGLEDYPVVHITWYDAQEYCTWAGKRLPTEAEWEKAARGVNGGTYPWGNDFPAGHLANYTAQSFWDEPTQDGYQFSAPVGTYPGGKSPYGALDMAGNVWEWVQDRYDENYYSKGDTSNPTGPVEGTFRVVRGGSYFREYSPLRSADREKQTTTYSSVELGFRCVQSE